jgi:hypothetical protein
MEIYPDREIVFNLDFPDSHLFKSILLPGPEKTRVALEESIRRVNLTQYRIIMPETYILKSA